ncbi:MAG TPA: lytic transglycosylase domain-containing protein, partial [Roseiarcus sp.]|nr:lytic transglycosylase domain-containing protein [Roseiarcus sp.]
MSRQYPGMQRFPAGPFTPAILFLAAFLAGGPAASQDAGLGKLASLEPVAPAVLPSPQGAAAIAGLLATPPRLLGAGAVAYAAAHVSALDWLMRKTPLAGDPLPAVAAAAALYQKGDLAGGDALARQVKDPTQSVALEWMALRAAPRAAGFARLTAFLAAHPDWPSRAWIVGYQEALLYTDRAKPAFVEDVFAGEAPRTPAGVLALANVERDAGRWERASGLVRAMWREGDVEGWLEGATIKDFAPALSRADHRLRTVRLLYEEKYLAALRAAALAGGDAPLLVKAWVEASHGALSPPAFEALPPTVKNDPGLLYARIQGLRRADRVLEAALLMARAPHEASLLVDGDKWWDERRMIARRLLDGGLSKEAYKLCVAAAATSIPGRIDESFHAGWIALRFLGDPASAARHFAAAAAIAETPLSRARSAYWQGRAAEQAGRPVEAREFYERAASYPIAYYGQLAADRLNRPNAALRDAATVSKDEGRDEATRVA